MADAREAQGAWKAKVRPWASALGQSMLLEETARDTQRQACGAQPGKPTTQNSGTEEPSEAQGSADSWDGAPVAALRGKGTPPSLRGSGRWKDPWCLNPGRKLTLSLQAVSRTRGRACPSVMPTSVHPSHCQGMSTVCGFSGFSKMESLPEEWLPWNPSGDPLAPR